VNRAHLSDGKAWEMKAREARADIPEIRTHVEDRPEDGLVVEGRAVPAPVPELVLALVDASLGAPGDAGHVVVGQLAELLLALGQALQGPAEARSLELPGLGTRRRRLRQGDAPETRVATHQVDKTEPLESLTERQLERPALPPYT
jgi:hypothetical protein